MTLYASVTSHKGILHKKYVGFVFEKYTEEILEWHKIVTKHCKAFTIRIVKHGMRAVRVHGQRKQDTLQGTYM